MTGTLIKSHQPCSDCESSDALSVYDDHTYCFSCGTYKKDSQEGLTNDNEYGIINSLSPRVYLYSNNKLEKIGMSKEDYVGWRNVSSTSMKFYDVKTSVDENNIPLRIKYPYGEGARKVRNINDKSFYAEGDMANGLPLFGMDKFSSGGLAVTITEGELDAVSAYQMMGSKYPAVSVRSASSAVKDCQRAYKYLDSFQKIYVCFDADTPGSEAAIKVAALFDPNKVYIVYLDKDLKDANGYLTQNKSQDFLKCWWGAKKYHPKNIIEDFASIEGLLRDKGKQAVASYPFSRLQEMTRGIRTGEVNLLLAQEGIGKTEVLRAIEHHILSTLPDANIGVIHLEEPERRSVHGLLSYELKTPVHLADIEGSVSVDDMMSSYKNLVKREGRLFFYTHFGSDDPDTILSAIRYLVTVCGCKFIFFDHITMLVTGFEGDDERKKLDYISTRLAMMCQELDFALIMISHVNDDGKTRGSRNISKIAHLVVALERDIESPDETARNTTSLIVKKNRFGAKTGPAGQLWFDHDTFTVREKGVEEIVDGETPF